MFEFSNIKLERIAVHGIGNKSREEGLRLSQDELVLDEVVNDLLIHFFATPFKMDELHRFFHDSGLQFNEIFKFAENIFENNDSFYDESVNIAKHLYDQSGHPQIKEGELYVVLFRDCILGEEMADAIGIFKSENKDMFLKVYPKGANYEIDFESGININKLDKGCIIFNAAREEGFKVGIVDNLNKSGEARYWRDGFLKIKPLADSYNQTKSFLNLCRNFTTEVLNEELKIDKRDQIEFMNRSVNFFAENENLDTQTFVNEVINEPSIIETFKSYKQEYEERNNLDMVDNFEISNNAMKGSGKYTKTIIKLDKNFHIYVHSKPEYLHKGYDEDRRMNYYQLFFQEES